MKKLNVGLIIDGNKPSSMMNDFIIKSLDSEYFILQTIICQETQNTTSSLYKRIFYLFKSRGIQRSMRDISFKCLQYFEFTFLKIFTNMSSPLANQNLARDMKLIKIKPNISNSGFIYSYSKDELKKISDLNLDILIRGGSGILKGEILTLCKFGIISFHHGNNEINRGGPPGFWEVYNREPSSGFIIQQLSEELDGGEVLLKGSIGTSFIYSLNLYKLMNKANVFLPLLLERIAKEGKLHPHKIKKPYSHPLYTTPSLISQLIYIFKTAVRVFIKLKDILLRRGMRWSIAYQYTEVWDNVSLRKSNIIKNPPNRFYADPCVINHNNRNICFVEDYCYKKSIGRISAIEITKEGHNDLGIILEEDFHLSFPYVFKVNEDLYMCPETYQAKEIRLYKCEEFPLKWSLHKVLIKNITAMDTLIFEENNKWWLMTNIDSSSLEHEGSELHIFHSDTFDSENWTPNKNNPVVFDSSKGRNAGLLRKGNDKFRVYQKPGFDMYGKSMGIAKIETLSEHEYKEVNYCNVSPDFFKNISGTHTYSHSRDLLVFDFVKKENFYD